MTLDLFHDTFTAGLPKDLLGPGTAILSGFALKREAALLGALLDIEKKSPFWHMVTPGGFRMSVSMANCGSLGWVTDRKGSTHHLYQVARTQFVGEIPAHAKHNNVPVEMPSLEQIQCSHLGPLSPSISPSQSLHQNRL